MVTKIQSHVYHLDETISGVDLAGTTIIAGEFHDCIFLNCSFAETVFESCRFVDCLFRGCDLSLAQVPYSSFASARFEQSRVQGVNWTKAKWEANWLGKPPVFVDSTINHSTFIGLQLKGIVIKDCSSADVDFREADLTGADFSGSDLSKSLFGKTNLTKANLGSARNYHIDPRQNTLTKAKFSLPEAISLLYSMDIVLEDEK